MVIKLISLVYNISPTSPGKCMVHLICIAKGEGTILMVTTIDLKKTLIYMYLHIYVLIIILYY